MKLLFIALFCFSLNAVAQTQTELNQEAYAEFAEADKELNNIYQNILRTYKSDSQFISKLKSTQRIWIEFRNAELEMKFPKKDKSYYGSSYPMCKALYLKELTEERTKKLKVWLNGIQEGDVCQGSVKSV